jgi:hypothetical protein
MNTRVIVKIRQLAGQRAALHVHHTRDTMQGYLERPGGAQTAYGQEAPKQHTARRRPNSVRPGGAHTAYGPALSALQAKACPVSCNRDRFMFWGEGGRPCLAPARLLLEAVPDLLGRLSDGQVLAHVAALPAPLLQLHAQREILCQRPRRRPAALFECVGADQKVGSCAQRGARPLRKLVPAPTHWEPDIHGRVALPTRCACHAIHPCV